MKNVLFLTVAALASFAIADVQLFTDKNCSSGKALLGTKHGYCYNVSDRGTNSALGCSVGHNLRVYSTSDCSGGNYQTKAPQKCASLGTKIKSIKCL